MPNQQNSDGPLWRLKWALLKRKCRGCARTDQHTHDLTMIGRAWYAPWIWMEQP
jgi:hypothetical protein